MVKSKRCDNKHYKRSELEDIVWNEIFKLGLIIENDEMVLFEKIPLKKMLILCIIKY